jgi:S1-C subfamily serine protease
VEIALLPAGPIASAGFELDPFFPGARVSMVTAAGAAAAAGLRPGDVITAVDGVPTPSLARDGVYQLVAGHPAGTTVEVATSRGAFRLTLR